MPSEASKGKQKIGSTQRYWSNLWTKLVEMDRVGDIELEDFKERYRALTNMKQ
jgi:hypothetical protein